MQLDFPDWQPLDPVHGDETPVELFGERRSAVVLLAGPSVVSDGWAPTTCVHLARHRAAGGGRVLLLDLGLLRPTLHEEFKVENAEGVTDALLFGASIERVAKAVERGLLFAPAGTPIADPAGVVSNPSWSRLVEAGAMAGAEVFLYLPSGTPGRDELLRRVVDVVLLGREEDRSAFDLPDSGELRAGGFVGPPDSAFEDGDPSSGGSGAPPESDDSPGDSA